MGRRLAFVVSHTHWDRAWYWTVEQTRVELVDVLDDLLALLAHDPGFRSFTLDGQVAMVHDYLAVRPHRAPEIRALARKGRLRIGPLYVLPDLFIPRGESLVRNLRLGLAEARRLGDHQPIAYLPDPFGHPAQLPQILRRCGIEGMIFARGLGDEGERLGADFWWEAPDGSRVLATHQVGGGYANLDRLADGAERVTATLTRGAAARVRAVLREMERYCPHGTFLLNNGCDLRPAERLLPRVLDGVRRELPETTLRHADFAAYHRAVRQAIAAGSFAPRVHRGELRGSRYANLLPGVLSARVDLKLRHDACERLLLRWAEPWAALASACCRARDDRALLARAWRLLLLCQPHDDICGCSIDAVHEDDLNRMARCEQLAARVRDRALRAIGAQVAAPGPVVFNPHPWPLQTVLATTDSAAPPPQQRHRGGALRLLRLPALGCAPLASCAVSDFAAAGVAPVRLRRAAGQPLIENGLVRLRVLRDGQLELTDLQSGQRFPGVAQLIDEGDAGDTYDFAPPTAQRTIRAIRPRIRVTASGPALAELELRYRLRLPVALRADRAGRSARCRTLPVTLTAQIAAASPLLSLQLAIDNTVDEHRLRLVLPTRLRDAEVIAGAPFQLVARPLRRPADDGWVQPWSPDAPFQDLVALQRADGAGLALLAPGLREYEARADARGTSLLVTLLRSVRWLSRDDLSTRSGHAGPAFRVEGARQQGLTRIRCALLPLHGASSALSAVQHARLFADPPRCASNEGDAHAADACATPGVPLSCCAIEPQGVILTALLPGPGGTVEARLLSLLPRATVARLRGPWRRAQRLRLDGRRAPRRAAGAHIDLARIPIGPNELLTLRLWPARAPG